MAALRIGVIGTGRIGRLHINNLVKHVAGAEVAAVADPLVAHAREWLAELGVPSIYEDHREILDRSDIDAVYICSSTDTHASMVTETAKSGKQIFCEKPIDLSSEKARVALAEVERSGVQMQVGFNRRFDRNFAEIGRGVVNGEIGEVHLVKITSRDPEPPPKEYVERSGGLFLDMMIHDFDMAAFIAGSPIGSVHAVGTAHDPGIDRVGDIDTAIVTLSFESGAFGVVDNSRRAVYGYDQRVEAFGTGGMLLAENDVSHTVRRFTADAEQRSVPPWFFLERYTQAFVEESRAFVEAVAGRRDVPVGGVDGLRAILVAEAANRSLAESQDIAVAPVG